MASAASRRLFIAAIAAAVAYVAAYALFRHGKVERWERDGREYVIVPIDSTWTYYAFRPAMHIDGLLTGMRFHLGPHR